MAGLAGADLAVRWRVCLATGIADTRRSYAPEPLKRGLRGPESAHPAFNVKDIKLFLKKLKSSDIAVTDAKIYAMPNIYQIYFFDPSANIIEVNQNIN